MKLTACWCLLSLQLFTGLSFHLTEFGASSSFATSLKQSSVDYVQHAFPSRGLIEYDGKEKIKELSSEEEVLNLLQYKEPTYNQKLTTRFNLWKQLPWKKFKGKSVLTVKIGGSLTLETTPSRFSFGEQRDLNEVESMQELMTLFSYAAYDPRIKGVFIKLEGLACGYAKLIELRRTMDIFKQSGKKLIGFSEGASEKELYLAQSFDEYYIPPDGGLDLRGFSGAATFLRDVLEKIGVEPQVQRIGKYKSAGDQINRRNISDAQREVVSSLLTEASQHWATTIAKDTNQTLDDVTKLWSDYGIKTPYDFKELGFITGVRYFDQVERIVKYSLRETPKPSFLAKLFNRNTTFDFVSNETINAFKDFDLEEEFRRQPRRIDMLPSDQHVSAANNTTVLLSEKGQKQLKRKHQMQKLKLNAIEARLQPNFLPGGIYLRKMRLGYKILKGLKVAEVPFGPRIAVINAIGAIGSGESSNSPVSGRSIGSNSLVRLIRRARLDPNIKAVVLRVDSPGGSALASDVMWRELRGLSSVKPVVASMVDVAASGGYYLSMACDKILAEELTITGSIGVVTAKFNSEEFNRRIGYNVETISIGRYAEVLSTSRSFTEEESEYFAENAERAYKSFTTKAAASRNMPIEDMLKYAQGRVWTGRQALDRKLVDATGGLMSAVYQAASMTGDSDVLQSGKGPVFRIQTLQEPRKGLLSSIRNGGASTSTTSFSNNLLSSSNGYNDDVLFLTDDVIMQTGLASTESLGVSPLLSKFSLGSVAAFLLKSSGIEQELAKLAKSAGSSSVNVGSGVPIGRMLEDILLEFF